MSPLRRVLLVLLAIAFVSVGISHFVITEVFVAIVPPSFPAPHWLVWISGVAEIALGVAVLVPKLRPFAGWGLLALLVAVFPANIHMAIGGDPRFAEIPRWVLWGRLPLQAVLAAWAIWATDAMSIVRSRRR